MGAPENSQAGHRFAWLWRHWASPLCWAIALVRWLELRPDGRQRLDWELRKAQRLRWCRFPAFFSLVLFLAPLLIEFWEVSMLQNLFEINSVGRMVFVACITTLAAWVCGFTMLISYHYAPFRLGKPFEQADEIDPRSAVRWIIYTQVLALPCYAVLYINSNTVMVLWMLLGVGLMVILLGLITLASNWVHKTFLDSVARGVYWLLTCFRSKASTGVAFPGFFREEQGRLVPVYGHAFLLLLLFLSLLIYAWLYQVVTPASGAAQPAALAYLMLLLILWALGLSAFSFLLDRYRVPLLPCVLLWYLLAMQSNPGHKFEVEPLPKEAATPLAEHTEPIDKWVAKDQPLVGEDGEKRPRPIVVVCASGGGIHASAWTARVLRAIHREFGHEAIDCVRLVSGASGGSVGLLYFLEAYPRLSAQSGAGARALADKMVGQAEASALSEVGWGVVFEDTRRGTLPFFASAERNRGWAMEKAWRKTLGLSPKQTEQLTWKRWVEKTGAGELPGVVFTSYDVSHGERFLFSTIKGAKRYDRFTRYFTEIENDRARPAQADPDWDLEYDINIFTAARMSATFPYVSPIAGPASSIKGDKAFKGSAISLADGGFCDNSGMVAALEWVDSLINEDGDGPGGNRDIILIEARAFRVGAGSNNPRLAKLKDALLGPMLALYNARSAVQRGREGMTLELLKDKYNGNLYHVVFEPGNNDWPLSWHMSKNDRDKLDEEDIGRGGGIDAGLKRFGAAYDPPP